MATEILDLRRTDERNTYLHHPTWIEMAAVTKEALGKATILMSFPLTKGKYFRVHDICCLMNTPFVSTGNPVLIVGRHTIATDDLTTGGTAVAADPDAYIASGDISEVLPSNIYFPKTSAFVTQMAAGQTYTVPTMIVGRDTTVDCISAELSDTGVITEGEARIYALISAIPGT